MNFIDHSLFFSYDTSATVKTPSEIRNFTVTHADSVQVASLTSIFLKPILLGKATEDSVALSEFNFFVFFLKLSDRPVVISISETRKLTEMPANHKTHQDVSPKVLMSNKH